MRVRHTNSKAKPSIGSKWFYRRRRRCRRWTSPRMLCAVTHSHIGIVSATVNDIINCDFLFLFSPQYAAIQLIVYDGHWHHTAASCLPKSIQLFAWCVCYATRSPRAFFSSFVAKFEWIFHIQSQVAIRSKLQTRIWLLVQWAHSGGSACFQIFQFCQLFARTHTHTSNMMPPFSVSNSSLINAIHQTIGSFQCVIQYKEVINELVPAFGYEFA